MPCATYSKGWNWTCTIASTLVASAVSATGKLVLNISRQIYCALTTSVIVVYQDCVVSSSRPHNELPLADICDISVNTSEMWNYPLRLSTPAPFEAFGIVLARVTVRRWYVSNYHWPLGTVFLRFNARPASVCLSVCLSASRNPT
jgi:hypothetical protein